MKQAPERADFSDPAHAGFFGDHAARYEYAAHFVRDKRVIDAACGTGYGTVRLKLAGADPCLGIDIDAESIARVQKQYGQQRVDYACGDCEALDFGAYHPDVVVSFETAEHLRNPARFFDGVRRGLGAEGVFLVSCPNDELLGDHNPHHLQSWSAQTFHAELNRYFADVVVLGQVLTPSAKAHYEFGRYLDDQLRVLRSQPWSKAWRLLRRLLRRPAFPPRPAWPVFVPGQHDWWFVPETGPSALCLLAVCRRPRSD